MFILLGGKEDDWKNGREKQAPRKVGEAPKLPTSCRKLLKGLYPPKQPPSTHEQTSR